MTATGRSGWSAWQVLLALAGTATSIVIFVYLVGGAIVWERLHALGLPANQAVAPLPRNLMVVVGVRALAWPVFLGLVVAVLVVVLSRLFALASRDRVLRAVSFSLFFLWCGALVALFFFVTVQQVVFVAAIGLLVALGVAVVVKQKSLLLRVTLSVSLAMVAVVVVVELIDISTVPVRLEYAHVRFTGGDEQGFYLGGTSDTIYLAPNNHCHVRGWIVALPQRTVTRLEVFRSTNAWPKDSGPRHCLSPPQRSR